MSFMKKARIKKDIPITGFMAKWYDKNTRKTRMSEMQKYAGFVTQVAPAGAKILEIAPGPGILSIELAKRGFLVTGVELSADFVEIEQKNAIDAGVEIDFRQGNASALPVQDGEFDFIICSAAFKNFHEPLKSMREMHRALKASGTALVLDMNREQTREDRALEMRNFPDMKGFDRWFVNLSFKTFLRNGAYTKDEFESLVKQTGFLRHEITKEGICLQVWMHK